MASHWFWFDWLFSILNYIVKPLITIYVLVKQACITGSSQRHNTSYNSFFFKFKITSSVQSGETVWIFLVCPFSLLHRTKLIFLSIVPSPISLSSSGSVQIKLNWIIVNCMKFIGALLVGACQVSSRFCTLPQAPCPPLSGRQHKIVSNSIVLYSALCPEIVISKSWFRSC